VQLTLDQRSDNNMSNGHARLVVKRTVLSIEVLDVAAGIGGLNEGQGFAVVLCRISLS